MNVGGPSRRIRTLCDAFNAQGYQTHLVYGTEQMHEGTLDLPACSSQQLPSLVPSIAPRSDARALLQLRRVIRDYKPHIVHTHMAKAGALGRYAASLEGVPVILHTYHGHVLRDYFSHPKSKLLQLIERRLASRTHRLIAITSAVRNELLEMGVGSPPVWRVVHHGLDLAPIANDPRLRADAKTELGLPPNAPVVGIPARLVPIKNHEKFFRIAALIAQRHPDARFLVAGDGPRRKELQYLAQRTLGDTAVFVGWVHDLPCLYKAMDVAVLTSKTEGAGAVLLEAGAAGTPVVAMHVGGVPEIVQHGVTGYLVSRANEEEFALRVHELLSRQDIATKMALQAQQRALNAFSIERLIEDVHNVYQEAL